MAAEVPQAAAGSRIAVELAWVEPDGSVASRAIELPAGSRVGDALAALKGSRFGDPLLEALTRGELVVAVYGERCGTGEPLNAGDRVELLGDLAADPKLARRRRVDKRRAQQPRSKWRGQD